MPDPPRIRPRHRLGLTGRQRRRVSPPTLRPRRTDDHHARMMRGRGRSSPGRLLRTSRFLSPVASGGRLPHAGRPRGDRRGRRELASALTARRTRPRADAARGRGPHPGRGAARRGEIRRSRLARRARRRGRRPGGDCRLAHVLGHALALRAQPRIRCTGLRCTPRATTGPPDPYEMRTRRALGVPVRRRPLRIERGTGSPLNPIAVF
jgi:hypothetical protein